MLFAAVYAGGAGARARRRSRRASWRRRCRAGAYEWNAGRFMHDSGWGTGSPGSDGLHVAPGLHREQLFALRHEPPPAPGGSCATAVAWPSPRRACRCPSVKPRFPRKAAYYAASSTSFPHPCGARKSGGGARSPAAHRQPIPFAKGIFSSSTQRSSAADCCIALTKLRAGKACAPSSQKRSPASSFS